MRAVLQVLVGGVGVDRGHQAALDAERVVEHLGQRREAVRGAGRVADDRLRAVVEVVVDAHDDRDVVVGGRRRDDDLLGATGVDVLAGVGGLGEEAGRLDDDVDAQVAPRQVGRVALGEHLHRVAADLDALAVGGDVLGQLAQDAVVLQQVGEDLGAGEVVDRHDLDVLAAGRGGPPEVAADPAESVDAHADRHCRPPIDPMELSLGGRTSRGHARGNPIGPDGRPRLPRGRPGAAPATGRACRR